MGSKSDESADPDLTQGVAITALEKSGIVRGQIEGEAVIIVRSDTELFAVGATCTHYSGPLAEGLVDGKTIRCPWHHACFSLSTGEAIAAPAFDPIPCWNVERRGDRVFVTDKMKPAPRSASAAEIAGHPENIVIIGGGAAGFAAAEMLRRRKYAGRLTMLSSDSDAPYDRPNLSKDFLAGSAPAEWLSLRSARFYEKKDIDLHLETTVSRIDTAARMVTTADGLSLPFDRLLLATGAEPVRPPIPGVELPNVFVMRSWADSRSIIERAAHANSAVIIGAGFIGLETAAALRERGLDVHVVAPEALPLEKVVGAELGAFIRSVHEQHGVRFHLKDTVTRIGEASVTLRGGDVLKADLVIIGVGVKPRTGLAKDAGIETGSGICVNAFLETNVAGIFAAGDVAEWQPASGGEPRRVEHWVVAERQGQVAAANMLGAQQRFIDAPFFWSAHYDISIRYVGYARNWDAVEVDGDIAAGDAAVRYKANGRMIAIATIWRDRDALLAVAELQDA